MSIASNLLPEFDQEMKSTRAVLACIPESKTSFKPHPKSWSLGDLSLHVANMISWTTSTLNSTELDFNPVGGKKWVSPKFESAAATLHYFDETSRAARKAIEGASDADMQVMWSLKNAGVTLMSLPRVACLRSFVMNHHIHHRGQLTVYLRLCDVPLPSVYGPTADTPV
jgi:uncharacterized damage-inducible protein DinB